MKFVPEPDHQQNEFEHVETDFFSIFLKRIKIRADLLLKPDQLRKLNVDLLEYSL
jgi:hypothetical protein